MRVKCTKHDNCVLIDGSHVMTLYFEHTVHDFKEGTVTTNRYSGKALEALSNAEGTKTSKESVAQTVHLKRENKVDENT